VEIKIILVVVDSSGAIRALVTDDLRHLLLDDAIRLVRRGILTGAHVVEANGRLYLRSNANSSTDDNLVNLSVTAASLSKKYKEANQDRSLSIYAKAYGKFLELNFDRDELLYLDGVAKISRKEVIKRLQPLAKQIKSAAKNHGVDPYLLAAILIDELARLGPDDLLDVLGKLGVKDTTVGLAQVKLSTARDMIKKKYYPADPNISQSELYDLLVNDKVSIEFAAAYLNFITKYRSKKNVGASTAELATCYSEGLLVPASRRGKQIAEKLRKFAKGIVE
jgi:hypothetical protein